jgi:NAD(P)H dehydrogenase (quinone)
VSFTLGADGIARPALTHIRRIAGISTYGRPRWTAMLVRDPPRAAVTRYLRMLTGGRARTSYLALYDMNRADLARRQRFLAEVRASMARL